jgi:hypothetical protein
VARFPQLDDRGWARVAAIFSGSELVALARTIGSPVARPNGEFIKRLTPTRAENARLGTLSATYGTGKFPFHTDTAFWPLPCRYVVLRALGDFRRPINVSAFTTVLACGGAPLTAHAERSLWLARTPSATFYCSMRFRSDVGVGWRFDRACMHPANASAVEVAHALDKLTATIQGEVVYYCPGEAIIIDNWRLLHSRGAGPSDEGARVIERVYVR